MMYTYLPQTDHVWITTDCLVHFHKNKFDEMLRKLDSTEYPCRFQKYPCVVTQRGGKNFGPCVMKWRQEVTV